MPPVTRARRQQEAQVTRPAPRRRQARPLPPSSIASRSHRRQVSTIQSGVRHRAAQLQANRPRPHPRSRTQPAEDSREDLLRLIREEFRSLTEQHQPHLPPLVGLQMPASTWSSTATTPAMAGPIPSPRPLPPLDPRAGAPT